MKVVSPQGSNPTHKHLSNALYVKPQRVMRTTQMKQINVIRSTSYIKKPNNLIIEANNLTEQNRIQTMIRHTH